MPELERTQNGAIRTASSEKGQRTRQAIVVEARRILTDEGYESFVLSQIALSVGITPGNLQYYFANKQDLLWEAVLPELQKYRTIYQEVPKTASSGSGKLLALIDFLLEDIRTKPTCNIWFTIWALAAHDKDAAKTIDKFYEEYIQVLAELFRSAEPDLSPQRSLHLASVLTALIDGMTIQIGYGKSPKPYLAGIENEIRAITLRIVKD